MDQQKGRDERERQLPGRRELCTTFPFGFFFSRGAGRIKVIAHPLRILSILPLHESVLEFSLQCHFLQTLHYLHFLTTISVFAEPNIVSQTAHSLRRGVRKRDLNDTELRDIISELMGHIRIGHILPLDSEVLTNAAKRSLISTLPPYMLGEDNGHAVPVRGITSWLRGRGAGPFIPPRYFVPYVEEAKSYLTERLRRPGETMARRDISRAISQIPDTLYMVDKSPTEMYNQMSASTNELYSCCSPTSVPGFEGMNQMVNRETEKEVGSGSHQISQLPVIEQRILVLMKQREQELRNTAIASLALVANSSDITKLIQLRVVREFGLPDVATEVLHNTASYVPYPATETTETATDDQMTNTYGIVGMVPSSGVLSNLGSNGALASEKENIYCSPSEFQAVETVASDSPIPPPLPPIDTSYLSQYAFDEEVSETYFESLILFYAIISSWVDVTQVVVQCPILQWQRRPCPRCNFSKDQRNRWRGNLHLLRGR